MLVNTGILFSPPEGGESEPAAGPGDSGCYSIESTEGGEITFANPYLMVGGNLYTGPGSISIGSSCIVALKISATSSYSCSLKSYGSVEALKEAQKDLGFHLVPLYQFDVTEDAEGNTSVSVLCDFRNIPSAAMGEF